MDDNLAHKYEYRKKLIGGKIVAMSPAASNHNRIAGNIFGIFWSYLRGKPCVPYGDGELVYLTAEDTFIPDFMIVCDRNKIKHDGIHGAPDLVVEILSPSTAKNDRGHKKSIYEKSGVQEYWIVSPSEKSVEIYRSNGNEFVFHDVYSVYADWMLEQISEAERAAVVTQFKCCLFDDLDISLNDIFYDILP